MQGQPLNCETNSFLDSIKSSQDPDLCFKYIEVAVKCNQTRDVERIIRETKFYDPVKVKDFLMEAKMADPKPLMFLCDMYNFVDDLTRYLFKNNFFKHIEIYVLRLSPQSAPIVLGTLIDLECDEKYILGLLSGIRSNCPIEQLVAEFEKRNKLRMLESWLEARVSEGNQVPALHDALAKICIDTNKDPQNFLTNNPYYDSKMVGKYAEEIDPHLAIIAYKRAWGQCDQELVEVTNMYKMFRIQAKYVVERRDKALWGTVLKNPNSKDLIEQVISSALPDSKNTDEVIVSIEAFMAADLSNELIHLWEKIVLHNSESSPNLKIEVLMKLGRNDTLTALHLNGCKISDDGATALAEALETNKTLTALYLNRCEIGDDGATALARALECNKTLKILDVGSNQIGDSGAKALGRALEVSNTLTEIYLSDCRIGEDGATAIARGLETRIIRKIKFYDPVKVKDFLMEIKMANPKPLMLLCDMYNFVDDLTRYLFKNNFFKHIEVYVLRLSPQSAPIVLGTLIDLECDEKYILGLLSGIRSNCSMEQLVAEFEKRNKLRMLESWLEARGSEENQLPAINLEFQNAQSLFKNTVEEVKNEIQTAEEINEEEKQVLEHTMREIIGIGNSQIQRQKTLVTESKLVSDQEMFEEICKELAERNRANEQNTDMLMTLNNKLKKNLEAFKEEQAKKNKQFEQDIMELKDLLAKREK